MTGTQSDKEEEKMYPSILKTLSHTRAAPRLNKIITAKSLSSNPTSKDTNHEPIKIPAYPVPKLHETMERFIKTCKPLLTKEELDCTTELAKDFSGGDGQQLQCLLEERAKKTDNWLADWWIHAAYLSYRNPVICWSSPGLVYPFVKLNSTEEKIRFTARLIAGALHYKLKIDNGKIKQEMLGKQPMDMQQYHKVFGTCRVPGEGTDTMSYNPNSEHIIIIFNNRFWELQCFDDCCVPLSPRQLRGHLECVFRQCYEEGPAVGILSGQNRDKWHEVYEHLHKSNEQVIERIQSALFVVCLDKTIENNGNLCEQTRASHQTIFGGGSQYNAANRWYDKTIQFIISDDGINGLTYEHAPAEGGPVAAMSDYISSFLCSETVYQDSIMHESPPKELKFKIDSSIEEAIKCASEEVDKLTQDLDMACFTFCDYGKEFIKSLKLGPDSFIQMAMQYAYYQTHSEPAATYESCAMRHFIHGRTETIRSCSTESYCFTKAMTDKSTSDADKAKSIREAVASHKDYITACLKGQGIDRHFLGMKLLAKENNLELHPLFSDPGFLKTCHYKLATSQVPLKAFGFMCYGPVVQDGYGCCYNPRTDDIVFAVSSFKSDPNTDSKKFAENLTKSLKHMSDVLAKNQKSNL